MKKLFIFLVFISCACEAQLNVTQGPLIYNAHSGEYGNHFIVGIGPADSNGVGFGATVGPTTAAGTCYVWDDVNGELDELTTADLPGATNGSAWKKFALDHYNRTGQPVVFIQGSVSGSSFYPNAAGGLTNNWQVGPTGVCYDNWKDQMDNALAFMGRGTPDLIACILGINDEQGSVSEANFITGVDAVMDQLDIDYPGVQKLWTQIGRWSSAANSSTLYDKRKALQLAVEDHPTHAMAASGASFIFSSGYVADNVHYSTASLNYLGASYDKYLSYTSVTNKWARGMLASLYTTPTTDVFNALEDLVTYMYDEGFYFTTEGSVFLINDDVYNTSVDIPIINSFAVQGATFTANNYYRFDGVNDAGFTGVTPSYYDHGWTVDDAIFIVKVLTNRDLATTAAGLFGSSATASHFFGTAQDGSSRLNYRINDQTVSLYTGQTKYADNTFYSVARSGTTKLLLSGSTTLSSVTQASTGLSVRDIPLAAWNINGTLSTFLDCDLQFYYAGKYSTIPSLSGFLTKVQAVIDAY